MRARRNRFSWLKVLIIVIMLVTACSEGRGVPLAGPPSATAPPSAPPSTGEPAAAPAAPLLTPSPAPSITPTVTALPSPTPSLTATATPAPSLTLTNPVLPLQREQIVPALRGGGYIIFIRHAATDPVPDDAAPVDLGDCATQRNLSAAGREQARAVGEEFRRLGIPVGNVLSSPFCRALDTARLAFDRAEIEPLLENPETAVDNAEREMRAAGLRRLLSTPPEPGTNTILAAHGFNINDAAGISIAEGEAAIFYPGGEQGFTLAARVRPEEWSQLPGP